jgi:hypothetical protein
MDGVVVDDAERAAGTALTRPLALRAPSRGFSASVVRSSLELSSRNQIKSASKSATTMAATIELRVMPCSSTPYLRVWLI